VTSAATAPFSRQGFESLDHRWQGGDPGVCGEKADEPASDRIRARLFGDGE
jgi:hypothetical protein